ncbi:HAMP domain-containing protein [Hydrogenivirga caldilitoris]|uniref:histidine kinase n=1 Tax=Hydrogenivirga caldilitoris TaxID=246264 RepID=A0A497XPU3_9AQUI|nr:cache domain-containing protein [Hydrogenivirga caldilitoris]RLJ70264.1 HAMP domain-containing protein [Hydrogenivirga caldilitoris]
MVGRYFKNASLIEKFVVPNVIILVVLIASVAAVSYYLLQEQLRKQAEETLNNGYKLFLEQIKTRENAGLSVAYLVSQDPDVKKAFKSKNRDLLYKYVKVRTDLETLTGIYDLRLHFLAPVAISFFRSWNPERFGIDVSKFRRIIVTVAERRAPQKGIEIGLRRAIVTGAYPVMEGNEYLGAVELITPFNPILDDLKGLVGMDTVVLIDKKAAAHAEWAVKAEKIGSYLLYYETNPILRELMLKAKDKPETVIVVQNYAVMAKPIFDFSRRNVGLLLMGYDLTPVIDSYKQIGVYILMFVFVGLIFSFFISYMIFKKYVEDPINTLIEHTERISMGDVDQKIPIESRDEIGRLAEAFDRMRLSIKKVMDLLK